MPEILMPKLSDTMAEGTLVAWKKKRGDQVSAGDLFQLVVKHTPSPELNAQIQEDAKACAAQYLKRPASTP